MSPTAFASRLGVSVQRSSWWRKRQAEDGGGQAVTFVPAWVAGPDVGMAARLPRGVGTEATNVTAGPVQWMADLAG